MLELARYQKQALPKAAGDEDIVLSAAQMYRDEANAPPQKGKVCRENTGRSVTADQEDAIHWHA